MQGRPEPPAPGQPESADFIDVAASDDPDQVPAEASESIPPLGFPVLGFAPLMTEYTYDGRPYLTVSPELHSTLPPPSSYPTASTALSMGDNIPETTTTSDAPGSSRGSYSSNPRSVRYNPIGGVPSVAHSGSSERKVRPTKHEDPTDNSSPAHNRAARRALRRQEIRRPQIGSEQRRRDDELRASCHRLKNAVPAHGSHQQRPSKIALLDRATSRINCLEKGRQQLLAKIREVEEEAARLRQANEAFARPDPPRSPAAAVAGRLEVRD